MLYVDHTTWYCLFFKIVPRSAKQQTMGSIQICHASFHLNTREYYIRAVLASKVMEFLGVTQS